MIVAATFDRLGRRGQAGPGLFEPLLEAPPHLPHNTFADAELAFDHLPAGGAAIGLGQNLFRDADDLRDLFVVAARVGLVGFHV